MPDVMLNILNILKATLSAIGAFIEYTNGLFFIKTK